MRPIQFDKLPAPEGTGLKWIPQLSPPDDNDKDNALWSVATDDEVTDRDRDKLRELLMSTPNRELVVEIGVDRNGSKSFTHVFLANKSDSCYYVGVDLADKSYLNNVSKRIYTIKGDSSDTLPLVRFMAEHSLDGIDLVLIDGWHSINQVLKDWRYSDWVHGGAVVFHDTNAHPGPLFVFDAIDERFWHKEKFFESESDYGMAVAWRR